MKNSILTTALLTFLLSMPIARADGNTIRAEAKAVKVFVSLNPPTGEHLVQQLVVKWGSNQAAVKLHQRFLWLLSSEKYILRLTNDQFHSLVFGFAPSQIAQPVPNETIEVSPADILVIQIDSNVDSSQGPVPLTKFDPTTLDQES